MSGGIWKVKFPGHTLDISFSERVMLIHEQTLTRAVTRFNYIQFYWNNLISIIMYDDKFNIILMTGGIK
jgi:hypothetical protein